MKNKAIKVCVHVCVCMLVYVYLQSHDYYETKERSSLLWCYLYHFYRGSVLDG